MKKSTKQQLLRSKRFRNIRNLLRTLFVLLLIALLSMVQGIAGLMGAHLYEDINIATYIIFGIFGYAIANMVIWRIEQ